MKLIGVILAELALIGIFMPLAISCVGNLGLAIVSLFKRDGAGVFATVFGLLFLVLSALVAWVAVKLPFWAGILAISGQVL